MNYGFWNDIVSRLARVLHRALRDEGLTEDQIERIFERLNDVVLAEIVLTEGFGGVKDDPK